jgi:hypothetical protein
MLVITATGAGVGLVYAALGALAAISLVQGSKRN